MTLVMAEVDCLADARRLASARLMPSRALAIAKIRADARGSRLRRARRRNASGEMSSRIASPLAPSVHSHLVDQHRIKCRGAGTHPIRVRQDARRSQRWPRLQKRTLTESNAASHAAHECPPFLFKIV